MITIGNQRRSGLPLLLLSLLLLLLYYHCRYLGNFDYYYCCCYLGNFDYYYCCCYLGNFDYYCCCCYFLPLTRGSGEQVTSSSASLTSATTTNHSSSSSFTTATTTTHPWQWRAGQLLQVCGRLYPACVHGARPVLRAAAQRRVRVDR